MRLTRRGDRYVAVCSYEERTVAKGAGFRWDPVTRVWWTASAQVASRLGTYADDTCAELCEAAARRERTREQSRAATLPDDWAPPCPEGLAFYPYQKAGIRFLFEHDRVLLGDEMGLGKTPMVIGLVNADPTIRRVLVVPPSHLRLNWAREIGPPGRCPSRPASPATILRAPGRVVFPRLDGRRRGGV